MMKPVLDQLDISQSVILADKAYGSAENRKYISDRGAQYCIPPKEGLSKPWKCDYFHYKERHLVECFFMKIKDYRRVSDVIVSGIQSVDGLTLFCYNYSIS